MVLAVFAALVAGIGAEVEHVPAVGGPDEFPGEELADQFLVVMGLVFLGIVALLGVGGVPVQGLAAVFADAHAHVGVLLVELVEPGAVHVRVAAVPAEIVVEAAKVGDGQVFRVHGAVRKGRQGGQADGIHLMHQVVEDPVVFQQIGILFALHGDLVAQAPHADGGVVIALGHKLGHLADGVFPAAGHVLGDIGDLRPDDQARLVAQVIEILVVLVMGQPDGGGAHLQDQLHVFFVVFGQQGVAQP